MNLHDYRTIIFDFDGVMFDTNLCKRNAVREAAAPYLSTKDLNKFVCYFSANNGIPREIKINTFFTGDTALSVLNHYKDRLDATLDTCKPIPGFIDFITNLKNDAKNAQEHFILSGGDRIEICNILEKYDLVQYFSEILTGPSLKEDNLGKTKFERPALFFGDSKIDIDIAFEFELDFIFLTGATEFNDYIRAVKKLTNVMTVTDFRDL